QAKEPLPEDITGKPVFRPLPEIRELTERQLTDLPPRYFYHKSLSNEAELCRSFDMPTPRVPPAVVKRLVDASNAHFAIPKSKAEELIRARNSAFSQHQSSDSMGAKRHGNGTSSKPKLADEE